MIFLIHSSGSSVNPGWMLVLGWISIWLAMFCIRSIVSRWAIHRFWLPSGFPQHFWFSCSTNCRNWSTRPRRVLMCCLLSLTWMATSSIICKRILWAPPDKLVMTASPDTRSFNKAQMYWNRRWFLTEERKSKRLTASPSPLNPAISLVQRKTIWQWGGIASKPNFCPSVAFLNEEIVLLIFNTFHFLVQRFMLLHNIVYLTSSSRILAPSTSPSCLRQFWPTPRH